MAEKGMKLGNKTLKAEKSQYRFGQVFNVHVATGQKRKSRKKK